MNKDHNRSFGLDLARAFAICLVLLSHFGHNSFDAFGFWGVELFFALSGFLIGQILWRNFSATNTWDLKQIFNFWSRRWWRTVPNYFLFFLIMLLLAYLQDVQLPGIGRISQFLWFGQNLVESHFDFYPVAWSLCIEEWFYLLFPLFLFVLFKTGLTAKNTFTITLLLFFAGSITIRYLLINSDHGTSLRTITFARLDAIASGVAVAYVLQMVTINKLTRAVLFITGSLIVCIPAVLIFLMHTPVEVIEQNPIFLLTVPVGFAITLPFLSTLNALPQSLKSINITVNKLSLWSYSIYLSHMPIMWLAYSMMADMRQSMVGNLLSKLSALTLTIMASALVFRFFEVPFTKKRPSEYKPIPRGPIRVKA
ncbi:acyltransferase family protein [Mucilaginibacter myungsuensis]|uniref:Acyltransferase n=1 Tax=Mucilaginibacter myungsuensis TaxID=649104 RepID=A0A929PUX1_9SPHI|nr:acyltransferase [Mucilaginibacter myungsuensis]MBE9660396.1 acyltransferase [Mucilaginibacter myungsuensis]MDN3600438.1 acyltransferase [Mucilaginibacter myungsuensis]